MKWHRRKDRSQPRIDEEMLMQFDRELNEVATIVMSIRSQLRLVEDGRLDERSSEVVSVLKDLQEGISAADARVLSELALTNGMLNDMADQLADLNLAVASQGAQLADIQSGRATVEVPRSPAEPLRALVAAADQLGVVVAAGGPHADVVGGQRANLVMSLEVLGVREIAPEVASPIDARRVRTDARPEPTEDRALDGRVFEVLESGWERTDGSELLRLPSVRVYEYREPATTLPEPEPPSDFQVIGLNDEPPPPIASTSPTNVRRQDDE